MGRASKLLKFKEEQEKHSQIREKNFENKNSKWKSVAEFVVLALAIIWLPVRNLLWCATNCKATSLSKS